jgi:hypothetical protein
MSTVLETLYNRLRPKYVGWTDQYKAVLHTLGIPLDMPMADLQMLLEMYKDSK